MVLGRNDKRKRKEGDLVDLMDPLSESPKRTKVHAQRKFAQGAATVFSPAPVLVKEKEKTKPAMITELISHKRPNTEDFLTFLCFRGTSILPPSLNFFNVGSKKEKLDAKASTAAKSNTKSSTCTKPSSCAKPTSCTKPTTCTKSASCTKSSSSTLASSAVSTKSDSASNSPSKVAPKNASPVKKKIVTNGVQKTLNKYKNATSTVQALKKKYQEQRLAKQRIKNKFKASCVMRTRSSTERVVLKSVTKLAPRKFISRNETKRRHGLRSGGLADRAKKTSVSVAKVTKLMPPRPKKRIIVKEQTSESSDSETASSDDDDEETRQSRNASQSKRTSNKTIQKKICTRSKSEMRRITRSQRESSTTTTTSQQASLSRRPSRKTKEAAAVYMEILGRKLVSPDIENDDNISVDSFPELPNARRTAQAENEIRAKSKAVKSKDSKEKEMKNESTKYESTKNETTKNENTKNIEKTKVKQEKTILKSKRTLRVRRYCELDSEDESETSIEPEKTRQLTRRSTTKVEKPATRSLRSSSRNQSAKVETKSPTKFIKDKTIVKRPKPPEKRPESDDSEEEETLGNLLNKMNKERKEKAEKRKSSNQINPPIVVESKIEISSSRNVRSTEPTQVSDDEESFRGFTEKAISKVLNSCQSHVNANLLATEEARGKFDVLKTEEPPKIKISTEHDEKCSLSLKNSVEPLTSLPTNFTISQLMQENLSIVAPKVENIIASLESEEELEKKCNHTMKNEVATMSIIDMPITGNHGRKARVNMSTEQIEKWLNESSMARAKQRNKSENESTANFHFEIPEKTKNEVNHLSIPTRIQHLVRPVNVTIPKLVEKAARERAVYQSKIVTSLMQGPRLCLPKPLNIPIPNRNKINADMKEIIKGRSAKLTREISMGEESDSVSKSDQNSIDGSPDKKSTPEKKGIFHQRKTFLPKVKERKTTTPSANAFSPENESSVYAFESDTEVPINTPFRRKLKEFSNKSNSGQSDGETRLEIDESPKFSEAGTSSVMDLKMSSGSSKTCSILETGNDKFAMPKSFGNLSNVQVLPLGKMPTEWGGANCSASIAVQVNFDEQSQQIGRKEQQKSMQADENNQKNAQFRDNEDGQQKCTEISTQTENTNDNESDNDGHVFYIPLQTVGRNGPNLVQGQQLIQGVAVKLGTEGPNGPNQRVLLRAQLVTKPPIAVARCPPVGTVQPTTRNPPNASTTTSVLDHPYAVVDPPVASTSAVPTPLVVPPQTDVDFQAPQQQSMRGPTNQGAGRQSFANITEKLTKSPKATRERKTSVDSTKTGKRGPAKSRQKISEILSPSNSTIFPCSSNSNAEARLVEAPTFHPTEKDFQDPLEYIDKIRSVAEKFGICRVVPPANFKPECKVSDDMRFTAYNQYVHRMLHRWGPNVKEMMAIKKYLATQSITLTHPPWIGGMEVDLPHLYQTVQSLGGLKEVIEKKKWQKVADGMKIPKSAQDRVTKLDDIYCKYLLPYDTLSPEERGKLFDDVEEDWKKRETKTLRRLDAQLNENDDEEDDDSSDEIEECIIKGRNMPLNAFYRIARNTQRMWFGENQRSNSEAEGASAVEVESAFWRHVAERKRHVCVHAASIDSSGRGFGFSVAKNSPFARHPWNLKVLTNNAGSVLRALGPLMGVTVPTLHVGMLFSACCWYRDPHGLPWIEYLHTGAKKIWYGIPDEHNNNFREALSKMVPRYCKKKTIWLPSDTAMVPPEMLVNNDVPLCRTVQEPGQFIIVFPKAFTSSICTGYVVSESVYFAQPAWLENAEQVFKDLQDSCEPSIFSFERLLFSIINDSRSHYDVLKQIMPAVMKIRERELDYRKQLEYIGLTTKEKLPLPDTGKGKKGKRVKEEDGDFECETCRANLFVSLVNNSQDDSVYCLPHALQLIVRKKQVLKNCTLMYAYTEDELDDLIHKLEDRIEAKSKKANQIRQSK